MRKIKLSGGKGKHTYALVDNSDYKVIRDMGRWRLGHDGKGYVRAVLSVGGNTNRQIFMHHVVLAKKSGFVVDHENNNSLDNRLQNLRYATHKQNSHNTSPRKGRKYKGVLKANGKYYAVVNSDKGKESLGPFDIDREAAKAYNKLSKKHFGRWGYQNKI